MGGYGALWIGLNNPDVFGAVYGMSAAEPAPSNDFLETHTGTNVKSLNNDRTCFV